MSTGPQQPPPDTNWTHRPQVPYVAGPPAYPTPPYVQPPGPAPLPGTPEYFAQRQPQWQPVVYVPRVQTSGFAVASLVLSILGLLVAVFTWGVLSLMAVIFGHIAIGDVKREGKGGYGMAVAGLIMGYLVLIPAGVLVVAYVIGRVMP
jgi:Domain of unknown function (DUF4190)